QILAHQSSFFEALFFGDFKESSQSAITLEDVTVKEMLVILNIVYGKQRIQDGSVEDVLRLADKFGMEVILLAAEISGRTVLICIRSSSWPIDIS
ncbi:hypothetical protein PFISCL1PPCAC_21765, partial [Pristionchus fissidentatus]